MAALRVLDLFSGIGGFSLGLERAGFRAVAFCECEPFPRRVLAKHWPEVPIYDDVRTLSAGRLAADGIAVDVICGGFPCQDVSLAGKGAGLAGERSGLWREFARLIGEVRPRYAIVENVAALLGRGLGDVLGDLAALGYDAEWHCIPASAVGAPHQRDRVWLVAHAAGRGRGGMHDGDSKPIDARSSSDGEAMADPDGDARHERRACHAQEGAGRRDADGSRCWPPLSDGVGERRSEGRRSHGSDDRHEPCPVREHPGESAHADGARLEIGESLAGHIEAEIASFERVGWWFPEPNVGRVADGVPARVDRITALGNAVVPQVVEALGRAILRREGLRP